MALIILVTVNVREQHVYEYVRIYASVVLHTIRRKLVGDSGKDVKQLFF